MIDIKAAMKATEGLDGAGRFTDDQLDRLEAWAGGPAPEVRAVEARNRRWDALREAGLSVVYLDQARTLGVVKKGRELVAGWSRDERSVHVLGALGGEWRGADLLEVLEAAFQEPRGAGDEDRLRDPGLGERGVKARESLALTPGLLKGREV